MSQEIDSRAPEKLVWSEETVSRAPEKHVWSEETVSGALEIWLVAYTQRMNYMKREKIRNKRNKLFLMLKRRGPFDLSMGQ